MSIGEALVRWAVRVKQRAACLGPALRLTVWVIGAVRAEDAEMDVERSRPEPRGVAAVLLFYNHPLHGAIPSTAACDQRASQRAAVAVLGTDDVEGLQG